jgi:hypothetical protein
VTREDVVARVRDLAGPLGPFQSLEEQLRRTDDWLQSMGDDAVDELLGLITTPASADELRGAEDEVFTEVLGELLCRVAKLRPTESVPRLAAHLRNDRARPFVADALGSSGSREAEREIAVYLKAHPGLTPDELLPLVEAAAELNGPDVAALLDAARDSLDHGPKAQRVRDRIDELLAGRL